MDRSILVIAYFYPPVGGAGVQRITKFTKYLAEFDWRPTVLTVENPSVPLFDESMLKDVPEQVTILRARTLEPGYEVKNAVSASASESGSGRGMVSLAKNLLRKAANFILQPDPQILWYPHARRLAGQYLKDNPVDAILATGPPFSSFVLGYRLSRAYDVPLVLDYRDEWDISNEVLENKGHGRLLKIIQGAMQKRVLKQARLVVATTKLSTETLRQKMAALGASGEAACVYNGYDAADIQSLPGDPDTVDSSRYTLSYVGTLWNLTSIQPVVDALLMLSRSEPDLAASIELVVAGRKTAEQEMQLDRLAESPVNVVAHAYLDHAAAVSLMRNSQGLCLLLSDLAEAGRVVPAKTFEYMTCGNSIFIVAPRGEVWDLLHDYPRACFAEPGEIESIAAFIRGDVQRYKAHGDAKVQGFDAGQFERRTLTGKLAALLDRNIDARNETPVDRNP